MTIFQSRTLIEPFAGGASAGVAVLLSGTFDRLILVELDHRMAAFWTALLDDKIGEELVDSVRTFEVPLPDSEILLSLDAKLAAVKKGSKEYRVIRKERAAYSREYLTPFKEKMALLQHSNLALWALVKNRCSFGGYLDGGFSVKGLKKPLKDGTICYQGLRSRWHSKNLVASLQTIRKVRSKITFIEGDAFDYLPKYPTAFAFVDPPYSVGGKGPGIGIYRHHNVVDHDALFRILSERPGPWWATYNDVPEVLVLIEKYGFESEQIKITNLRAEPGYHEIVIHPKNQVWHNPD
jgi:DNA adenine methylase